MRIKNNTPLTKESHPHVSRASWGGSSWKFCFPKIHKRIMLIDRKFLIHFFHGCLQVITNIKKNWKTTMGTIVSPKTTWSNIFSWQWDVRQENARHEMHGARGSIAIISVHLYDMSVSIYSRWFIEPASPLVKELLKILSCFNLF